MDVKTLCLSVLSLGEASGYEIRKHFEEGAFRHFQTATFGSIYPALGKLYELGHVSVIEHEQDGRPDKKVYTLTESGRAALQQALLRDPAPDAMRSDLLVQLFFAHLLPPEKVAALIDQRIAEYRACIEKMSGCTKAPPGHSFVQGMGLAIYAAAATFLEENKAGLMARLTADRREKDTAE